LATKVGFDGWHSVLEWNQLCGPEDGLTDREKKTPDPFYFHEKQRQPIGYSRDENGRPCATYEIKKDTAYETRCDYGGEYPASVSNPLSKQAPSR